MLILRAQNIPADGKIAHGFFGRTGGVSPGIFASLNCGPGSSDARDAIVENRRRVSQALAGRADVPLLTLHQIHSANARAVTEAWGMGQGAQADSMATTVPGLALGILTADCAPVLFADVQAGVIGAAHAGWKGAFTGVLESTLDAMERLGAERARIRAAIGPCISRANYEVGPEFHARFAEVEPASAIFFSESAKADHWRFDLEAYAAARLEAAGVHAVERASACTYAREGDFFSYRRATHRGEPHYGRQVSTIMLRA